MSAWNGSTLVQVISQISAASWTQREKFNSNLKQNTNVFTFISIKWHSKYQLQNVGNFVQATMCSCGTLYTRQSVRWQLWKLWNFRLIWNRWRQCVDSLEPSDVISIWNRESWSTLVTAVACCLMATSHYLNQCLINVYWTLGTNTSEPLIKMQWVSSKICISKYRLQNGGIFALVLMR